MIGNMNENQHHDIYFPGEDLDQDIHIHNDTSVYQPESVFAYALIVPRTEWNKDLYVKRGEEQISHLHAGDTKGTVVKHNDREFAIHLGFDYVRHGLTVEIMKYGFLGSSKRVAIYDVTDKEYSRKTFFYCFESEGNDWLQKNVVDQFTWTDLVDKIHADGKYVEKAYMATPGSKEYETYQQISKDWDKNTLILDPFWSGDNSNTHFAKRFPVKPPKPTKPGKTDPKEPTKPGKTDPKEPTKPGKTDPKEPTKPGKTDPKEPTKPGKTDPKEPTKPGKTDPKEPTKPGKTDPKPAPVKK
eukprot:gene3497-3996_t